MCIPRFHPCNQSSTFHISFMFLPTALHNHCLPVSWHGRQKSLPEGKHSTWKYGAGKNSGVRRRSVSGQASVRACWAHTLERKICSALPLLPNYPAEKRGKGKKDLFHALSTPGIERAGCTFPLQRFHRASKVIELKSHRSITQPLLEAQGEKAASAMLSNPVCP